MIVLHADSNNPLLIKKLQKVGYHNIEAYHVSKEEILANKNLYDGIIIRRRFKIEKPCIDEDYIVKFIARVRAGLESIDVE